LEICRKSGLPALPLEAYLFLPTHRCSVRNTVLSGEGTWMEGRRREKRKLNRRKCEEEKGKVVKVG